MAKDFQLSKLANSLRWWLNYTSTIGRSYVLTEGAIKFPVSEYLEGSKIDDIILEYGHPQLSKRRFDLFFKNYLGENNAYEFKYIKNGSTRTFDEKQRIFDDLMRLYLFLENDRNGRGYFLICGNQGDFIKDFQKLAPQPTGGLPITPTVGHNLQRVLSLGFYTEWFSFDLDSPDKTINTSAGTQEHLDIYEGFLAEYSKAYFKKTNRTLDLPNTLKTRLLFLSGNSGGTPQLDEPSKVGIWEVAEVPLFLI